MASADVFDCDQSIGWCWCEPDPPKSPATQRWQSIDVDSDDPHEPEYRGDPQELIDAMPDLRMLLLRPAWQRRAACRGHPLGPGAWFPGRGDSTDEAREVCRGCPVQRDCLDYALANGGGYGVWADTSSRQRRKLRSDAA